MTPPSGKERDIALLGAFCLFLSALDYLIPKPLPFMRIGLANLPLLLALASPGDAWRPSEAWHGGTGRSGSTAAVPAALPAGPLFSAGQFFLLALIKVMGQALVTGTLFSYVLIFSLTGTALSAAIMYLCRSWAGRRISLAGIGIAGAFASNAAQLALARLLVFGEAAHYLAPPFLAAGIVSGGALGLCAEAFAARSRWLRLRHGGVSGTDTPPAPESAADSPVGAPPGGESSGGGGPVNAGRTAALIVCALAFLAFPQLPVRAGLFVLFWLAAALTGKRTRPLFTLAGFAAIVAANLFPPFGKILVSAGPLLIARGSLLQGLQRAITMEGLIMFSRLVPGAALPLPGKPGRLLRESFAILEELNREDLRIKGNKKTKRADLFRRVDDLLCRYGG